jgi:hypothetical protein
LTKSSVSLELERRFRKFQRTWRCVERRSKGSRTNVIYLETAETIHLLAFAHDKRRPAYWLPRTDADPLSGAT